MSAIFKALFWEEGVVVTRVMKVPPFLVSDRNVKNQVRDVISSLLTSTSKADTKNRS